MDIGSGELEKGAAPAFHNDSGLIDMHDKLNRVVWAGGNLAMGMEKYKAVLFDLFETLITEWGHKKYTKREMCADLGIEREKFDRYWDEKEEERYCGKIRLRIRFWQRLLVRGRVRNPNALSMLIRRCISCWSN